MLRNKLFRVFVLSWLKVGKKTEINRRKPIKSLTKKIIISLIIVLLLSIFLPINKSNNENQNIPTEYENITINGTYYHETVLIDEKGFIKEISLNNNFIVWYDGNIAYIHDILNETNIRLTSDNIRCVKMSEMYIVWGARINGTDTTIGVFNISNKTVFHPIKNRIMHLGDVYTHNIVWSRVTDNKTSRINIYLYNISSKSEKRITYNDSDQFYPSVFKNIVIWWDLDKVFDSERESENISFKIISYNLKNNKIILIKDGIIRGRPQIYENKIIWTEEISGKIDIYMYNLLNKTIINITNDKYVEEDYEIFGNKIVWCDNRSGDYDIFMYDLSEKKMYNLTHKIGDQQNPKIYKNKIIWVETGLKEILTNVTMIKPQSIHFIDLSIDFDNDTIPDYKDEDDDNDGFSDLEEIEKGTNPLDKNSFPIDDKNEENDYLPYFIIISSIITICVVIILFKIIILKKQGKKEKKN